MRLVCYSGVLQARAKLIDETDSMRRQNAELRILLHQYVTSQASHTLTTQSSHSIISLHGIAMLKGLYFTAVVSSFFRRLISKLTERISTKFVHIHL